MENIVIATIKEWNIQNYFKIKFKYQNKFTFHLITSSEELTFEYLDELKPKYIFFPHWSWIIQKEIFENFECVVFHMTDLPYGRGGSPLQNLIVNGVYNTKISALKVSKELDSGDIYLKEDLDISEGSAREIFIKASKITFEKMIPEFLENTLVAKAQVGEVFSFKRRNPNQSDFLRLNNLNINKAYDFIRMLDAEGYPKAYIDLDNLKIEFYNVKREEGKLIGTFEVIENE